MDTRIFYPIFIAFLVFLNGCFEKPVEKITERHADGSKRVSVWVKSDGTIRKKNEWFSNGIKRFEVPYKDGMMHGDYTIWSVHGDVIGKGKYRKGELDGPQNEFFTDRRKRSTMFYAMGKREGFWQEFYFDGGKKSEMHFENDKPVGVSKLWHKNGNLAEEFNCFENVESGFYRNFAENGKLKEEFDCRFGVKHGAFKTYYPGGALKTLVHLENGVQNGLFQEFFANGKTLREGFYKLGIRDSVWMQVNVNGDTLERTLFENGNGSVAGFCDSSGVLVHCSDTVFVNGKIASVKRSDISKNLRYEELWENGEKVMQRAFYINIETPTQTSFNEDKIRNDSLASEAFYKNGKLHGVYRNWHSNGKLQDSLNYIEGERFGEQISYDRYGKITKHTKENGKTGQVIFLRN